MIDSKELRQGNIIGTSFGNWCTVIEIYKNLCLIEYPSGKTDLVDNTSYTYCYKELTPEIMKENLGFNVIRYNSGYHYYYPNEDALWSLRLANEETNIFQYAQIIYHDYIVKFDPIIKYVHQVQNLYFALIGEELEIKIPK